MSFTPPHPDTPADPAPKFVAGWYPDNANPGIERWYDGHRWTDHRQPIQKTNPASDNTKGPALGYVFAVIMPFVGAILGVVWLASSDSPSRKSNGVWILVLSIVMFFVYASLLANSGGGSGTTY